MDHKREIGFRTGVVLFSLYTTAVVVLNNLLWMRYRQVQLAYRPWFLIAALAAAFLASALILLWAGRRGAPLIQRTKRGKDREWVVFTAAFLACLGLYVPFFLANYPGGMTPDTQGQWEQAHTLQFNDHHPAFHTFLIWLLTRVVDAYPFVIAMQILAFAFGVAILATTMYRWGFSPLIVGLLTTALLLCNQTFSTLAYAWKDAAMSLLTLFLLPCMINVFYTQGRWLSQRSHRILCAALLAALTLVRHNAMLFTLPLALLWLLQYPGVRKACVKTLLILALLVAAVKGPLYAAVGVEPAQDGYQEALGLPMTILSSAYVMKPETLTEETFQFMEDAFVSDHETVKSAYRLGDFNTIKWACTFHMNPPYADPLQMLRMTWDTVKANPQLSLISVMELTDALWDPTGALEQPFPVENDGSIPPLNQDLQDRCDEYVSFIYKIFSTEFLTKITGQLGILLLALLTAYVITLKRWGMQSLWLVLPILLYNFGTMLLLCGTEYRYFHFNCFLVWPIVLVLLSREKELPAGEAGPRA